MEAGVLRRECSMRGCHQYFAGNEEKERAATMALILGEQTEQGFGICFKVIKVHNFDCLSRT